MARIFITGSADGLGQLAAKSLVEQGHQVVLHARNESRGLEALDKVPRAETVLIGDLSSIDETKQLAAAVNALGSFDAVIHNAGVYQAPSETIVKVNILAPYILTSLIDPPKRLIYLSSGMHTGGQAKLAQLKGDYRGINYSDSKLQVLMLTLAVARLWYHVSANAVDPGWVPTKMGGAGAPDDLQQGYETQTWLATSDAATLSGQYYFHRQQRSFNPEASKENLQNDLLKACEQITGVKFPQQ
ncbi:SDR family NAD(P)-dependent oxidoreductase [Reichenbachiella agarivorans]|uniref:SDR family NAD(P)-dependent oxidoreductase n=1 Tax=Reichenbachiella agarivorans TaxID=2979464 RepID=A0ABY6CMC7_9BACT|nr:SDR family NAD(P)-dependent oxidoreductase [Reichenbachiella agarivorans]UXP31670.1 SDR family NAD(P)-dependent oxidoreductase [Reichenbachiella agarivorans]